MGGWGGGGYAAKLFLLFSFPCSADHERDWPPCKVVFYGLATNTLNVRNNNNNNNIQSVPILHLCYNTPLRRTDRAPGMDRIAEPQLVKGCAVDTLLVPEKLLFLTQGCR